jgi:tRNA nucleotidyltransferase/poly(A) polymerase
MNKNMERFDKYTRAGVIVTKSDILDPLVKELNTEEQPFGAWIVGGVVRDIRAGVESSNDIDIVTTDVDRLVESICNLDIWFEVSAATYQNSGAKLVRGRLKEWVFPNMRPRLHTFEISPIKGASLVEDAALRDFTIDAVYIELGTDKIIPQYHVMDPIYGNNPKVLVPCMGDRTFLDSPVRIFRAADMMCRKEKFEPTATLIGCISRAIAYAIRNEGQLYMQEAQTLKGLIGLPPMKMNGVLVREQALAILDKMFSDPLRDSLDIARSLDMLADLGAFVMIDPRIQATALLWERNKYHNETVWNHTMQAIRNVRLITCPSNIRRLAYWAILLHDIGKLLTGTHNETGDHFIGHEIESAKIAEEILKDSPLNKAETALVLKVIRHHMDTKCMGIKWFGEDEIPEKYFHIIRRLHYDLGSLEAYQVWLVTNSCDGKIGANQKSIIETTVEHMRVHKEVSMFGYKPPISGDKIQEVTGCESKMIGKYLEQLVEIACRKPELVQDEEACIKYIKTLDTRWIRKHCN